MASFTKRGNTWQYTISRTINGKQKPICKGGFRTKKEAQEAALQVEVDLKNGVLEPKKIIPLKNTFWNGSRHISGISPI